MAKSKAPKQSSRLWTIMSLVSGVVTASLTRKALNTGWRKATGKEPPANPADPDVALREAVMWAVLSGTAIAVARMFAGRRAAHYYQRSVGHLPPELEADSVREARAAASAAAKGDPDTAAAAALAAGKAAQKKAQRQAKKKARKLAKK